MLASRFWGVSTSLATPSPFVFLSPIKNYNSVKATWWELRKERNQEGHSAAAWEVKSPHIKRYRWDSGRGKWGSQFHMQQTHPQSRGPGVWPEKDPSNDHADISPPACEEQDHRHDTAPSFSHYPRDTLEARMWATNQDRGTRLRKEGNSTQYLK